MKKKANDNKIVPENKEMRDLFGRRIRKLRQQKRWTQKKLAEKLGISLSQFNKYEYGLHFPPAEKIIRLAEIFDTTTDYLLTGSMSDEKPVNSTWLKRFQEMENFQREDREAVIRLLDAMIVKNKAEDAPGG